MKHLSVILGIFILTIFFPVSVIKAGDACDAQINSLTSITGNIGTCCSLKIKVDGNSCIHSENDCYEGNIQNAETDGYRCQAVSIASNQEAIDKCKDLGGLNYGYPAALEYKPSDNASYCIEKSQNTSTATGAVKFKPQVSIPFSDYFIKNKEISVSGDLIAKYIKSLYTFSLAIAGLITFVMLIKAGLEYIFSRDTSGGKAKESIKNSILGLLAILITYQVLNTLSVNLVKFKTLEIGSITAINTILAGQNLLQSTSSCNAINTGGQCSGNLCKFTSAKIEFSQNANYNKCSSYTNTVSVYKDNIQIATCYGNNCGSDSYCNPDIGSCVNKLSGAVPVVSYNSDPGDDVTGRRNKLDEIWVYKFSYSSHKEAVDCLNKSEEVYIRSKNENNKSAGEANESFDCKYQKGGKLTIINLKDNKIKTNVYNKIDDSKYSILALNFDDVSKLENNNTTDIKEDDDIIILVGMIKTDGQERIHCDLEDGEGVTVAGLLKDDTRFVLIDKSGNFTDKVVGDNVENFLFRRSDFFSDTCNPCSTNDLIPKGLVVNLLDNMPTYARFCLYNKADF